MDLIELQLCLRLLHRSCPVDSVAQRLDPKDEGGHGDEANGDGQRNAKEQASERSACRLGQVLKYSDTSEVSERG